MANFSLNANILGHIQQHSRPTCFTGITCTDALAMLLAILAFHILCYKSKPGPIVWPIVGMLPQIWFNLKNVYDWLTTKLRESGGTFTFIVPAIPGLAAVITSSPSNIEHILKSNFHNFPKGGRFTRTFHDLLGDGIFNSDGQLWHSQRRIASIDIHSRSFRDLSFMSIQHLVHSKLLPLLTSATVAQSRIDFQDLMLRFTFDNICMLALGVDAGCLSTDLPIVPFAKAFDVATQNTFLRFMVPEFMWRLHRMLGIKKEKRLKDALKVVNNFAEKVIIKRKDELEHGNGVKKGDLLSSLMQSKTATYSDMFLRDFAVNFILAGRDTTSVALTWFMWLLAQHPQVEHAIFNEVSKVVRANKECKSVELFSMEHVKQMNYLHAAISESMRLYPPVPIDNKDVIEDDVLPDGTILPKGSRVFYSIYSMGRMESIWGSDCLEFKPERWLRNGVFVPESPLKFPVFNAGPRLCLGKDLAFLQMKYVAAAVVKNFEISLVPGHVVKKKLSLTLFMKNGLPVTVKPRKLASLPFV